MPYKKAQTIKCLLIMVTLFSCAGVKQRKYKNPTQAIQSFKSETKNNPTQSPKTSFLENKNYPLVKHWVKYFSGRGKKGFETFLKNGEKYRPMIEQVFIKHKLPPNLYYVGLIESGYKLRAKSHASAVGPWQFIKETGKRYGLRAGKRIDERQSIYKSTQAAALYFQDLYNIFGSWELALSAYNAGEYGVIRRIRGANTRDYYRLSELKVLPKETRNYVPKIIAAMTVAKNYKKYNISINQLSSQKVEPAKAYKIIHPISVNDLSRQLNISRTTLKSYNADIKSSTIPHMGPKDYYIYLPKNRKYPATLKRVKKPRRKLANHPKSKLIRTQKGHIIKKGETLSSISKKYNIKLNILRRYNNIKKNRIYVGQKLSIPGTKKPKNLSHYYTVKKGDHLTKIANLFKTKTQEIRKLNSLNKSKIFVGQKIKVPAHEKKYHVVKRGEVLGKIARIYRTNLNRLKKLNNLPSGRIYPGQKILVTLVTI